MKAKVLLVLLALLALALGVALSLRHSSAVHEKQNFEARIQYLSNDLQQAAQKYTEQTKVNTKLEGDLTARATDLQNLSNKLTSTLETLAKVEADVQTANKAVEAAQAETAKRDAKITELETERNQLTKRMTDLNSSISTLETQIAETQRKLAASEGDREFLLKELKRLQAEKAELERQFNDLAVLREQVKKLKDELSLARRIEWIRRGLYGTDQKGAEKLQRGFGTTKPGTNYNLDVEIKRDGSAKIVTPLTNAPPAPPPRAP